MVGNLFYNLFQSAQKKDPAGLRVLINDGNYPKAGYFVISSEKSS